MTQTKPILYFDIGPLQEDSYTGIPAVTAAFAEFLMNDDQVDGRFIWDRYLVPYDAVRSLLEIRDGRFFRYHMRQGHHHLRMINPQSVEPEAVALFPNVKGIHGVFQRQAQIIHDLSTLLFPETHNEDTINHHAPTFLRDVGSNEFTFCVSEATRGDVVTYLGAEPDKVHTALLGADDLGEPDEQIRIEGDPYFVLLGTIEPRKNIRLVLELMEKNPRWAEKYRFVLIGRSGWGGTIDSVLSEYPATLRMKEQGRLLFTGYLDDPEKEVLLRNARALLFPSVFEGFGLPVLEALKLGTPVVCSYTSSVPEVAEDAAFYFDPFSVDDLERALEAFETAYASHPEALINSAREQGGKFTWSKFYTRIRNVIFPHLSAVPATEETTPAAALEPEQPEASHG